MATTTTEPKVIGYGIFDAFDQETLGAYGYGFLIHDTTKNTIEDMKQWLQDTVRDYYGKAPIKLTTTYLEVPEEQITHEVTTRVHALDKEIRDLGFTDLGYSVTTWDKLHKPLQEARLQEEEHRDTGVPTVGFHPLNKFFND